MMILAWQVSEGMVGGEPLPLASFRFAHAAMLCMGLPTLLSLIVRSGVALIWARPNPEKNYKLTHCRYKVAFAVLAVSVAVAVARVQVAVFLLSLPIAQCCLMVLAFVVGRYPLFAATGLWVGTFRVCRSYLTV